MDTDTKRRIVIVACKGVVDSSVISFKFVHESKIPDDKLLSQAAWGRLKIKDSNSCSLSIFHYYGHGTTLACSWKLSSLNDDGAHGKTSWNKGVLDRLPSCTLLAGPKEFAFWKTLCEKYGVTYEIHEYDGFLESE